MTTVNVFDTVDTTDRLEERLAGLFDDVHLLATGMEELFSAATSFRKSSPAGRRLRRILRAEAGDHPPLVHYRPAPTLRAARPAARPRARQEPVAQDHSSTGLRAQPPVAGRAAAPARIRPAVLTPIPERAGARASVAAAQVRSSAVQVAPAVVTRGPAAPSAGVRQELDRVWDAIAGLRLPVAWACVGGVVLAELLVTFAEPRLGMLAHCLLLLALLYHSGRTRRPEERTLLVALTLVPLIRVLSLALPLAGFPLLYWYLITGVPLFVAVFLARRALGFSWPALGLNLRHWPLQLVVGLNGLAFGAAEYVILRPEPLAPALTWADVWWPALILLVMTGLLEELIFRGLLQRAARAALGRGALAYVALLFTALHIGYRSPLHLLFILAVGVFLGWVVQQTGSLLGVALAHGLTNVALFLVIPFLL